MSDFNVENCKANIHMYIHYTKICAFIFMIVRFYLMRIASYLLSNEIPFMGRHSTEITKMYNTRTDEVWHIILQSFYDHRFHIDSLRRYYYGNFYRIIWHFVLILSKIESLVGDVDRDLQVVNLSITANVLYFFLLTLKWTLLHVLQASEALKRTPLIDVL